MNGSSVARPAGRSRRPSPHQTAPLNDAAANLRGAVRSPAQKHVVPLKRVTEIVWSAGDDDDPTMVVTGEQLAVVLAWLSQECPDVRYFANREDAIIRQGVLVDILRAVGGADLEALPVDTQEILTVLAQVLKETVSRLRAPAIAQQAVVNVTVALPAGDAA